MILAVVPSGGCANDSTGAGTDLGEGDGQAGNDAGGPRQTDGGAGDADAMTLRAGDTGEDSAPGMAAEGGPLEAGCASSCSTGPIGAELTFDAYPSLDQVGGSTLFQLPGYSDPACGSDVIIVLQPTAGEFLAFSASCTHACCAVTYQPSESRFYCGCHGSAYDLKGKVTAGPATRALTALKVCSDACGVQVMA